MKTLEKTLHHYSKLLSLVLRHQPETIGIVLDSEGWTDIKILLQHMAQHQNPLTREQLIEVVESNDKKRFQFSEDLNKIRAVQGHSSQQVQRKYIEITPPDTLFHGTATRFVESILKNGLIAGERHHVHLSEDLVTANKVGQRHGKVVIFNINTKHMQQDGYQFYQAENGVWLVKHVPTQYLTQLE